MRELSSATRPKHRSSLLSVSIEPPAETETESRRATTTLSVIVPVYNEQFLVEASLARLEVLGESSLLQRIKVIVVDDGSTDDTPAAIARFCEASESRNDPKFSWLFVRHERNSGKGAAHPHGALAR